MSHHPRGLPGRAVVVYYDHGRELGGEPPPKNLKQRVRADVRVDGTGPPVTVKDWLPGETAWLLAEGMEVPVWIDPQTGEVLGFHVEELRAELARYHDEYVAAIKHTSSLRYSVVGEKNDLKGLVSIPRDLFRALRRR